MKQEEFRRLMTSITPDAPEHFSNHVDTVLGRIVAQEESQMKESTKKTIRFSGRVLTFAMVAVLMLGTVAYAATQWDIFDSLGVILGTQPPTADSVMQANLHQETVNGVEIAIKEAGYDGKTLFLQYSYRMTDVTEPVGQARAENGERLLTEEDITLLDARSVGWWVDAFWINGQPMDMANNSGGQYRGSEVPGEIIRTEYWRLDNIDVELTGKVEVALPIGEKQSAEYRKAIFDKASGQYTLPDKGVVTFTLDTSNILSRVVKTNPNITTVTPDVTACVSEVAYTPLMTYITLAMEPNADALAAYKAEYGEGYLDEDGNLRWPFTSVDVHHDYILGLTLVDGSGKVMFPDHNGFNGVGDTWAEFTYPYMDAENLPEQLWLAPVDSGVADMEYAIRVK